MRGSMVREGKERNTTAPLVTAVPIWIANRIVGTVIHVLAKLDAMCLKLLILYRVQNANRAPIKIAENLVI